MGKKSFKRVPWQAIRHEQVYMRTRGHSVDIHVYPVMKMLWDAGIQTFFSCQGGPDRLYSHGKITSNRAYVVILEKDEDQAMMILMPLNPEVKKWENRHRRDQIAIKFDPSPEANAVEVMVKAK